MAVKHSASMPMCSDTDVLLLLLHFMPTEAKEVWMVCGVSKKQKFIPVHLIAKKLPNNIRENLLSFHALTGCDTNSSFSGHGKRKCWKVFLKNPLLVSGIGRDGGLPPVEEFVCRLYSCSLMRSVFPGF